jgi:hypothetical protein
MGKARDDLLDAVFCDVGVTVGAPGNVGALRRAVAFAFIQDLLDSLCGRKLATGHDRRKPEKVFQQIFQKVGHNQPGR